MDGVSMAFTALSQRAAEAAEGWDEYLDSRDGLMHCARCGEPTEIRFRVFGKERKEHCICSCHQAQLRQEEAERERQKKLDRLEQLRRDGFEDEAIRGMTFGNDDGKQAKVTETAKRYCRHFTELKENSIGICFYGNTGTGKTFTAGCIANELINQGYSVLMTNIGRIVNRMQNSFEGRQEYLDRINSVDLLIIDDLAAERDTEFVNEIVYTVIDSRYRCKRPLIVTTNKDPQKEFGGGLNKGRIYSRICEMCYPVEITGADRRRQAAVDKMTELKKKLGV